MAAPDCPFHGLDSLWIQVAGLSCNLRCAHCFNASGPGNMGVPDPCERAGRTDGGHAGRVVPSLPALVRRLRHLFTARGRVRERRHGGSGGVGDG